MKITRIDFEGFGALTERTINFDAEKLNLVVEANEYGKSTMVEAIWAIIYGLTEKETFRPWKQGVSFSASMDIDLGDKKLRIIRDFSKGTVQVLDLNFGLRDVTPQYLGNDNEDQVGYKLLGMNRDTFRNTCLVGQRHLDLNHMTDSSAVSAEIQSIADSSSPDTKVSAGLQTISQTLSRFMHGNRMCHINELLKELEGQRNDLMKRLRSMDAERGQCREWFAEIQEIDSKISPAQSAAQEQEELEPEPETFEQVDNTEAEALRTELKHIEAAIQKLKNHEEKKMALIEAASINTEDSPLPKEQMEFLMKLWDKHQAIIHDINLLHDYMTPHQQELAAIETEVMDRYAEYKGLDQFSNSEATTISTYAVNLFNLYKQMEDLRAKNPELANLNGAGTGEFETAKAKNAIFDGLAPEEVEEAKSYASLLVAFKEQSQDTAKKVSDAKKKVSALKSDRSKARTFNIIRVVALLVVSILLLAASPILSVLKVALPQAAIAGSLILGLITMLISFFFLGRVLNSSYFKQDEQDGVTQELQKLEIAQAKGEEKVINLENKIAALANKCGIADKKMFMSKLQEAAAPPSQKETDEEQLRQLYFTKQQNCKRLQSDLAYFFNKAGMATTEVEPQSAIALSENINDYRRDIAGLQDRRSSLFEHEDRMRQMDEELALCQANIIEFLDQNGFECQGNFEVAQNHLTEIIEHTENRNAPHPDLANIDEGYGDENTRSTTQQELIERHIQASTRLEALLNQQEAQGQPAPANRNKFRPATLSELMPPKELEELRQRKEDLTVKIRTTLKTRDELYLDTMEELTRVDHEIIISKRAKLALELAYEVLKQSSHETYADWSVELNKISVDLLQQLSGEIEMLEFSKDLNLRVKLRNHSNIFDSKDIVTKLSTGTKEQIHWMARLIISRFLSSQEALPIILDEPFSEADDTRFVGLMRFLIDTILPNNQVVIFSCHQQRHQWLKQQLDESHQEKLAFNKH